MVKSKNIKANEAPEKIYVHVKDGKALNTWNNVWVGVNDIEYTRTDAFIEKACEFLMDYEFNDSPTIADRRKRVEKFKKAMKGE